MGATLYDKVFDAHTVRVLPSGQNQLFVGLHLVHEVTSPQAFAMLRDRGLPVLLPERTFATGDHIIPTDTQARPFADDMAEAMVVELERNCRGLRHPVPGRGSGRQGIVHVVGPELGLTQPGMTVRCGDSHTSTHGAFGAIAFGIGTTQVRDVLATQTLADGPAQGPPHRGDGKLRPGVYAKDVILYIIRRSACTAAWATPTSTRAGGRGLSMEERMTVCNMSIEGGARCGYVEPATRPSSTCGAGVRAGRRRVGRGRGLVARHAVRRRRHLRRRGRGRRRRGSSRWSPGA